MLILIPSFFILSRTKCLVQRGFKTVFSAKWPKRASNIIPLLLMFSAAVFFVRKINGAYFQNKYKEMSIKVGPQLDIVCKYIKVR